MADENKSFRSVVGAKNIHIAIKKSGKVEWEKPVPIIGAGQISVSNIYAEGQLVGDMKTLKSKKRKTGIEVSAEVAEYTNYIKVLLEGGKIIKGTYANSADNLGNDVAILYEEVYDDDSKKYMAIYCVPLRAENISEADGGSEDIAFNKTTLSGTGVSIDYNGKSYFSYELDTGAEDYDKDQAENWYKEVQLPLEEGTDPTPVTVDIEYTSYTSGVVDTISIVGVTFDSSTNTFKNVPKDVTSFTFNLDGVQVTATLSGSTWNFVSSPTTVDVEYTSYTTGLVDNISLPGVTFDTSSKEFKDVPSTETTFTFDLDGVQVTATLSGSTWSFA